MGSNETVGLVLGIIIVFLVILIPFIFFLISQQNLLKAIQPQNRSIQPGEVWLQLIPIFGLVWQFMVVTRISDSIKRELWGNDFSFEDPNYNFVQHGERPTYNIGMAYCILYCCSIIPCVGGLCGLAGIICWIIYWVKLGEYKRDLEKKNMAGMYSQSPNPYQ